jgi:hypothetical protein
VKKFRGIAFAAFVVLGYLVMWALSPEWLPLVFLLGVIAALLLGAIAVVGERKRPSTIGRPAFLWWAFSLGSACVIGMGIGMLRLAYS